MQIHFESVAYRPEESIACFQFQGPKIICPYHHHPEYEIAWIVRSEGRVLIGDALGDFQAGDLYLLGANLPHLFWNHESTREARTVVIQFTRDSFGDKLFDAPEMRDIARLLSTSGRGLRWRLGTRSPLRRRLRNLGALRESERIIRFLEILRLLSRMAPASVVSSVAYGHRLSGIDSSRMETVTRHIRECLSTTVSQSEVARMAGMSIASFRRFFQRTTQRSFPRFVNELRISEACRFLVTTDLTVTEILYRCGYSNQANFYRRFRQILGTTPENYRRGVQRHSGDHGSPANTIAIGAKSSWEFA
ncbi:MAG: AraC family transcriptional regulator [Terrimicrobiaceae bacterium]